MPGKRASVKNEKQYEALAAKSPRGSAQARQDLIEALRKA
jgi:hypothetical protein